MLTLRRRQGESVMIGPDIEVRIALVKGRVVEINIHAPRTVKVDRKEVRLGLAKVKGRNQATEVSDEG